MDTRTEFSKKVIQLIISIPKGKVATYGLIAELAGNPRGSRGVGWLLHSSTKKYGLPWQRVIKAGGKLAFPALSPGYTKQKKLLEREGVLLPSSGRVDLQRYLWAKKVSRKSRMIDFRESF